MMMSVLGWEFVFLAESFHYGNIILFLDLYKKLRILQEGGQIPHVTASMIVINVMLLVILISHFISALIIALLSCRGDPLSNMQLDFFTPDDAISFCEKNGEYSVCGALTLSTP